VYTRRLAVLLDEQALVYGLPADAGDGDLGLHVISRIAHRMDCNLLMIAAHHLLLCQVAFHAPSHTDCMRQA
jgi:hypothetical protein